MDSTNETLHQMYRRHDDEMRDLTRRTDEMLGRIRGLREAMTIADDGSAHDAARLIRALQAAAWEEYDGLLAEQQAMYQVHRLTEQARRAQQQGTPA